MEITTIEMRGLLTGKCVPRDKKVNEDLAQYFVRKFEDHATEVASLNERLEAAEAELKRRDEQEPVATLDIQRGRPDGNKYALVYSSAGHALPDDVYTLYAAPAALLPQEKSRISQDGVALALSDYDTGWNECREATKALACQPEKVVSLPDYSNTYKEPFASEIFHHVTRQLDAAGVKWGEGE